VSDYLVTVASYWFHSDAILARNALEAAGIDSVLDDVEMAVNYPNAVHGVKLRVRNVDAIRAGEVLDSECESVEELGEADEPPPSDVCPACGAAEIIRTPRILVFAILAATALGIGIAAGIGQIAFFATVAAGIALLILDRYRCAECGESWN
jgi:predicted RNA-binding Zn-ribbon protein involved in translation (DUF1610 family)